MTEKVRHLQNKLDAREREILKHFKMMKFNCVCCEKIVVCKSKAAHVQEAHTDCLKKTGCKCQDTPQCPFRFEIKDLRKEKPDLPAVAGDED